VSKSLYELDLGETSYWLKRYRAYRLK